MKVHATAEVAPSPPNAGDSANGGEDMGKVAKAVCKAWRVGTTKTLTLDIAVRAGPCPSTTKMDVKREGVPSPATTDVSPAWAADVFVARLVFDQTATEPSGYQVTMSEDREWGIVKPFTPAPPSAYVVVLDDEGVVVAVAPVTDGIVEGLTAPVRVEPSAIIKVPEAARLLETTEDALYQRIFRGDAPPGLMPRRGKRSPIQFNREKFMAGLAKRAKP